MHNYTLYCSNKCSKKAQHKREREQKLLSLKSRNCKKCGKEFIPSNANQIYCSVECRKNYKKINTKEWIIKNEERYRATVRKRTKNPKNIEHKKEMFKKENDASREESMLEGIYKTLYTQEDDNYLIVHYDKMTKKDLAKALGRTIASVQSRFKKLKRWN